MNGSSESSRRTPFDEADECNSSAIFDECSSDHHKWTSALKVDVNPWDVAQVHLKEGGSFSPALLGWMVQLGCAPFDVGRFARKASIDTKVFLDAAKGHPGVKGLLSGFAAERPRQHPPAMSPDFDGRHRTPIMASNPESRSLADQAWRAIERGNDPAQLFTFGDKLAWVCAKGASAASVQDITKDRFSTFLHHRLVRWEVRTEDEKGRVRIKEVEPPDRVTRDMLANPHPPVPNLVGVRSAPVFGPSGDLASESGYHPDSEMFVWMGDLDIPFVPLHPTSGDIAKARHLIEFELLGDFPFEDEASKAHAVAASLHPFIRPMIRGATPIHLVDKPAAGTGAGLLVDAVTLPSLGRPPTLTTIGKLEDEIQFKMVALMRKGPIAVVFDNINRKLDSETIAAMVTADIYEGRVVKTSETAVVPIRCLWMATGNNVQVSHEMVRRCLLIRLDAEMENPEEGRTFRHEDLLGWAREHRSELVWAALVLVQAWVSAGMPRGSKSKASFESWARTISGIFEVCGIGGFLENSDKMKDFADPEAEAWIAFVEAWWERFEGKAVGSKDLMELGQAHLADLMVGGHGAPTAWGMMLRSKKDAVIGGMKIVAAGTKQHAAQWRLVPVAKK